MKNKFLMVLAIIALSFSFVFTLDTKETKADALIPLSYAGGTNLLDPEILASNQSHYYTTNKTYLPDPEGPLFFQIYFGWSRPNEITNLAVEFFDINLMSIGIKFAGNGELAFGADDNYYGYIMIEDIPQAAFSFQVLDIFELEDTFIEDGGKIMAFIGDEMLDEFEDFYPHVGLYDISVPGSSPIIDVSYDNPLTHDEIVEMIYCSDGYLGDLKRYLVVDSSHYIQNKTITGRYPIYCSVSDGVNTQSGTFYIRVVDRDFPEIYGPDKLYFELGEIVTEEKIESFYTVYDGYDGLLPNAIHIRGFYPESMSYLGIFPVTLTLSDSSGNTTEKAITLYYFDTDAPTIECPETVTINYQLKMHISEIISNYVVVSDTIDPHPVVAVTSDEYTGNERRLGTYTVEVSATDICGNVSYATMEINVTDTIAPVIYLNSYSIDVTTSVSLSQIDFEQLTYMTPGIPKNKKYTSTVLVDTYTGHEKEPGVYSYKMLLTDEDGNEFEKEFLVRVGENTYVIDTTAVKQVSYKNMSLFVLIGISSVFGLFIVFFGIRSKKLTKLIKQ